MDLRASLVSVVQEEVRPRRESKYIHSQFAVPTAPARIIYLKDGHPNTVKHISVVFTKKLCFIFNFSAENVGPDSSVGIATRYGLDGPGIESRCGRDFPHPSRPALRAIQPPIQWVPGVSRE